MVQRGNPLQQRDFYPATRETNWHPLERNGIDITPDGRFTIPQPSPMHSRALSIEAALRDCVRLPVKEFALIVLLENGEEKTYTSQALTPCQPRIFSDRFRHDFRRNVRRATVEGAFTSPATYQEGGGLNAEYDAKDHRKQSSSGDSSSGRSRRQFRRQSRSEESDEGDSVNGKRKRARGALYPGSFDNEDTPVPVPVQKTQQLIIGNEKEVEQFYNVRFKDMQQSSCKVMGKAFVKLVEPKKQTHHPYTKGDAKAPPWWPKGTGDNHVRHREPDHLLRPERIRLLVHILKMIIEPYHKQCPTVQKLGLNVKKLEEVTMEAMSNWFNDPEHPENAAKKPFLREIFKVAKVEERYKNSEIDGDTRVPVMYGDRSGLDVSDDEVEEGLKDEDEEPESSQIPNMPTPDSLVSQPMIQNQHLQQTQETETNTLFMPATRPLPVRYHTQPQMDEHGSYSNSSYLRTVGFQSSNAQDPTRRSFGSPVYPSPQSMYGWQSTNIASNGTMPSNYYVTSPQTTLGPQSGQFQLPPPPTTTQPMLPPMTQHHYDGLPTGRQFDSGPALGNQLRTGSLGHPHHMPSGFQEYLQDSGGYGQNDSEVRDDQQQIPTS